MEETPVKSAFFGGGRGYFLSQRRGIHTVSWPQAGHDGQIFPRAQGAKPVSKGRELVGGIGKFLLCLEPSQLVLEPVKSLDHILQKAE